MQSAQAFYCGQGAMKQLKLLPGGVKGSHGGQPPNLLDEKGVCCI